MNGKLKSVKYVFSAAAGAIAGGAAVGMTAAKAASKPEDPAGNNATDKLNEFIDGIV